MHPIFYKTLFFLSLGLMLILSESLFGQARDTIYTDTLKIKDSELPKHSPGRATLYSTFLPGLGQVYNRKYWKVPIIYVGIVLPLYFGIEQQNIYNDKRDAYVNRISGDSTDKYLEFGNFFTNEGLLQSMDINRRNRDLMFIVAGVIYVLQIVDASVDAHLFYFNVSKDLSFQYTPTFYYDKRIRKPVQGLSLSLNF